MRQPPSRIHRTPAQNISDTAKTQQKAADALLLRVAVKAAPNRQTPCLLCPLPKNLSCRAHRVRGPPGGPFKGPPTQSMLTLLNIARCISTCLPCLNPQAPQADFSLKPFRPVFSLPLGNAPSPTPLHPQKLQRPPSAGPAPPLPLNTQTPEKWKGRPASLPSEAIS